jgi:DNA-binding domain
MKQARHRAYQHHYEAAMSKVLREESRRQEMAKEAKKNKKRKLLPVVEDPVVKIDRRKFSSSGGKRRKPGEEDSPGFIIRLNRLVKSEEMGLEDEDDAEFSIGKRGHGFFHGRGGLPRYLPGLPSGAPGEQLTPSEQKAYDRIAKSLEKRFDALLAGVWKDIAKKDIPKAFRQMDMSLKVKQSNAKKTVQLAAKEARRWQPRSTKASKEMQIKSKKAMREVSLNVAGLT